jgi:T5SS/PEP-CTERM-associated repeat protein
MTGHPPRPWPSDDTLLNVGFVLTSDPALQGNSDPAIVDPGTTVTSGTTLTSSDIAVGISAGVSGTILVQGTSAAIVATNGATIGGLGQGILSIQNGGSMTLTAGGVNIGIGSSTKGSGTIDLGSAFLGPSPPSGFLNLGSLAGGITVGDMSAGALDVRDFGVVNLDGTQGLTVGNQAGATGLASVSGTPTFGDVGGVLNVATAGIVVGAAGTGTLLVQTLGSVNLTSPGTARRNRSSGSADVR